MSLEQTTHDEVDLFEVFQTLWRAKILIATVTAIFVAVNAVALSLIEPRFETKINIRIQNPVPLVYNNAPYQKLQDQFFNRVNFDNWSKGQSSSPSISYDDINNVLLIDDFSFQKSDSALFVFFEKSQMAIRTSNIKIIKDIHSYLNYVNHQTSQGFWKSRTALNNNLLTQSSENLQANDVNAKAFIDLQIFLREIANGGTIFQISAPNQPQKTFPNRILFLALAVFLGVFFSACYCLILKGIKSRQNNANIAS